MTIEYTKPTEYCEEMYFKSNSEGKNSIKNISKEIKKEKKKIRWKEKLFSSFNSNNPISFSFFLNILFYFFFALFKVPQTLLMYNKTVTYFPIFISCNLKVNSSSSALEHFREENCFQFEKLKKYVICGRIINTFNFSILHVWLYHNFISLQSEENEKSET